MLNGRQEDLTKVFDRTWKANHNDDVKKAKEHDQKLMNALYDNGRAKFKLEKSPGQDVRRLQDNMNNAYKSNREVNINNIVKKWK